MAPSSSSSPSSSKSSLSPPSLPPHHPPHFTPIQECEREENDDETTPTTDKTETDSNHCHRHRHRQTPLHHTDKRAKTSGRRRPESDDGGVSCNKCRPSNREKISVVPVDTSGVSPNGIFKSIISSLTKKSPRTSSSAAAPREEQWKIAVAELSHKLIQATRKRDEAVLEASRLKYSMSDLEKKLSKLEIYCHNLKSGLEICTNKSPNLSINPNPKLNHHHHITIPNHDKVIQNFLVSVSESRSSIRLLSRSLSLQLRQMGAKVYDRISILLQPYDIKISLSKNPRALILYLESLLNRAFFEDFESIGFQKSSPNHILNPIERCETNFVSFNGLTGLTWEEVLNKGTKHFSEEFSRFCDRKMSEIVSLLGWTRAWPEPLLQAFFGASKSVWFVHLLANSVHPSLPIFRVEKGVRFDSVYMEDMGGDKAKKLVPAVVRIMATPGFYVYDNVVKCKVLCRYHNNNDGYSNRSSEKGLTPSPV